MNVGKLAAMETPVSIWPIAVFQSRYSGVYEGGEWFAVANCTQVPNEAHGDDCECADWFAENKRNIGIGNTPNEAVDNLVFKTEFIATTKRILEKGPMVAKSDYLGELPSKNL
jgi:hypothetical protein